MAEGTIKSLGHRGFGFIETENGDLFFHQSALVETPFEDLREEQKVEYEMGDSRKGPCAVDVKIVSS